MKRITLGIGLCLSLWLASAAASAEDRPASTKPAATEKPASTKIDATEKSAQAEPGPVLLKTAREHLLKGRYAEAVEAFEKLTHDPLVANAATIALYDSYAEQGDWRKAAPCLTAIRADLRDAAMDVRLGEFALRRGEKSECRKQVDAALKKSPDLPRARFLKAELDAVSSKLKEADEGYRWFVRYYNEKQPTDPEDLLYIGKGAAQYARWHAGADTFDFLVNTLCPDMLKEEPNFWPAHFLSGELLLEKYNRAEGIPDLEAALAINPQASAVHAALAVAALDHRDFADAEKKASRALEINPWNIVALLVKADLQLEEDRPLKAREFLNKAHTASPCDDGVQARLAVCDILEDGPPDRDRLAIMLTEKSKLTSMYSSSATKSWSSETRFEKRFIHVMRQNNFPGKYLTLLGEQFENRKRFYEAEKCFQEAIAVMPQLSEPKTNLGLLYMRIGRNDEAKKILDKAFTADPFHVRVSNMRKVLDVLGTYETISTEHFIVRVDAREKVLGQYMANYLEEVYEPLVQQFGYEPLLRTQFEIFSKYKGTSAHQWFSARMVGLPWIQTIGASTGMMVAMASPAASEKPFNWARVLKHEFIHIVTLQQTEFAIPHWFTEALAVTNEGYPPPSSWDELLVERMARGDVMNLDTLNGGFTRPRNRGDWDMAYCQSWYYARYMREKFGETGPAKLLDAYRQGLSTSKAIEDVFHISQAEFEKGYTEYLNIELKRIQSTRSEPVPSLADAENEYQAHPDQADVAGRYALALIADKQRTEARQIAEKALAAAPHEPRVALALARLDRKEAGVPAAIQRLEAGLDREHPHPDVIELLAQLQVEQEQWKEAGETLDLSLQFRPRAASLLVERIKVALKLEDKPRVKQLLRELTVLQPDDLVIRKKLLDYEMEDMAWEQAIQAGRLVYEIEVSDVDVHQKLAQALTKLSRFEQALAERQVIVALKPGDVSTELDLAEAEWAAGQTGPARKRLEAIAGKELDNARAQELLKEFVPPK